jgi:hypothetical protein
MMLGIEMPCVLDGPIEQTLGGPTLPGLQSVPGSRNGVDVQGPSRPRQASSVLLRSSKTHAHRNQIQLAIKPIW